MLVARPEEATFVPGADYSEALYVPRRYAWLSETREARQCARCKALADPDPNRPGWPTFTVYKACRWCRAVICARCYDVALDCGRCG